MEQQILQKPHHAGFEHPGSECFSGTDPHLVPMDRVIREANRVTIAELLLAFAHCSVLLPVTHLLGGWTVLFGFVLVAGIYHSHLRKHVRIFLGRQPVGLAEKIIWPWLFVLKLMLTFAASFLFFLLTCFAVISLFYIGLRFGYTHSLASQYAGWWGFFPSVITGVVAGTFGLVWLAQKTLRLY